MKMSALFEGFIESRVYSSKYLNFAKREDDEKISDCFYGYVWFKHFGIYPDGHGQGGSMMGNDHGGGMMGGSWGWGMNYGWFFLIIIAILVIFGIVYMTKRK